MHMATDMEQFFNSIERTRYCVMKDLTSFLEGMCTICNLCIDVCNGSLSLFNE